MCVTFLLSSKGIMNESCLNLDEKHCACSGGRHLRMSEHNFMRIPNKNRGSSGFKNPSFVIGLGLIERHCSFWDFIQTLSLCAGAALEMPHMISNEEENNTNELPVMHRCLSK